MSTDIRSFDGMIEHLNGEAEKMAVNYGRFLRAVATAAYNFGGIDAMRGVWKCRDVDPPQAGQEDVDALVRRLWEDEKK